MAGEWTTVEIGSLCHGIFDGPHATPKKTLVGPLFLGISSLRNGRIELSDAEYLSEEDFIRWTRRVTPQENDIVFSYETRLGEAALIPIGLRCCLGRRMALMRPNTHKVDPRFLIYAYIGPEFQQVIRKHTVHGSTVDRIPLLEFPRFPIRVPPIVEQRAIASILGTLDDKIELNRQRNRTLEAMARAIFQSWFVDFDPVKAKVAGRKPPGLKPEIAALFPDRFEDSAIGPIPAGWLACTWGDIATLEYGKSFRGYTVGCGHVRVFGTNGPIGWHTESLSDGPGIVIGRKGAYRGVHYTSEPFYVIDTAYFLRPKHPIDFKWAYYQLLNCDINGMDSGSAIPSTSRADFYALPVCVPSSRVLEEFGKTVQPLYDRRDTANAENDKLSELRDALLPKLISGELRVPDAERIAGRLT